MHFRSGKLYLVFEFVDRNILELLTEYYPRGCDTELVRSTIFQVIRAIEYCHRHDVVHRDVKPENILVNLTDMTVKLCDFGFARSIPIPNDQPLTDYVATRWYRAPELLIGSVFYGPEVDVFAIGCLMSEVTDGEPLLPGDSEIAQLGLIQRVIGPLSADQLESFASNPRFVGMRIPLAPMHGNVLSLEERYDARINRRGLFLLRSLLAVDPAVRTSANRALCDSFFDGIYQQPKLGLKARLARPATVSSTGPRANHASISKKLASLRACPPRHAAPALQSGRSQFDNGFPTCNR